MIYRIGGLAQFSLDANLSRDVLKHPVVARKARTAIRPARFHVAIANARISSHGIHDLCGIRAEFLRDEMKLIRQEKSSW